MCSFFLSKEPSLRTEVLPGALQGHPCPPDRSPLQRRTARQRLRAQSLRRWPHPGTQAAGSSGAQDAASPDLR